MRLTPSTSVRPATLDDAALIARIHIDAWRKAYAGIVPVEFLIHMNHEEKTRRWQDILSNGQSKIIVFDSGGKVAGWASYGPSRDADFHGTEIWAIYVAPEAWRRNIGSELIQFIHDDPETTPNSIVWVLNENLGAQKFYRSMGYVPDGKEKAVEIGGDSLLEVRYQHSC